MLEIKVQEDEIKNENNASIEAPPTEEADAPQQIKQDLDLEAAQYQLNESNETTMLNPLNDIETHPDVELKGKQRRYWNPKEEERFFEIWGRENWRLTKHGKNTIYFAQWSEELKERYNVDIKPEEIQCKVNQTRAKFRAAKKKLESGAPKWKKFDLVEKILKNQHRSKDDEPVPLDALENNRDMSPTELLNFDTRPSSPNGVTSSEQDINLSQPVGDSQLAEDVNLSNISLSDSNLATNVFSNNSQTGTSYSAELFGIDQLDIKKEVEMDLMQDGCKEFITTEPRDTSIGDVANNNLQIPTLPIQEEPIVNLQQTTMMLQTPTMDNGNNIDGQQQTFPVYNPTNLPNNINAIAVTNNCDTALMQNHAAILNNHIVAGLMQPPKCVTPIVPTPSPRKRNSAKSHNLMSQDALEHQYLEEVKKKNHILVEQGEINRKRLRLEERKVKLMEEFFPKYLSLQQEILQKLASVKSAAPEASSNIKMEE